MAVTEKVEAVRTPTNTCIMLIGLPGSGKSTWREQYVYNNPYVVVISSDDIIMELGTAAGFTNYNDCFQNVKYEEAEAIMYDRLTAAIAEHKDIILDQTNLSKKSRKYKLDKVPSSQYTKVAKIFKLDEEELNKRLNDRFSKEGKSIPHFVLANMKSSVNYDVSDDGFDSIL